MSNRNPIMPSTAAIDKQANKAVLIANTTKDEKVVLQKILKKQGKQIGPEIKRLLNKEYKTNL